MRWNNRSDGPDRSVPSPKDSKDKRFTSRKRCALRHATEADLDAITYTISLGC